MNYVYIPRIVMKHMEKHILDIEPLHIYSSFETALININQYIHKHKIIATYNKHIEFRDNRIYIYQNHIDDQFIFIERCSII
jgi:hypothetical protein